MLTLTPDTLHDLLIDSPPEAYDRQSALAAIERTLRQATSFHIALQMLGPDPFLDLIYAGETVASIARLTSIPHRLLRRFIDAVPDVDQARQAGAEAMVDNATMVLQHSDQETISTNKAKADHHKWMAERIDRKHWGRNVSEEALLQPPFQLNWVIAEGVQVTPEQLAAMGSTVTPAVDSGQPVSTAGTPPPRPIEGDYEHRLIPVSQVIETDNMPAVPAVPAVDTPASTAGTAGTDGDYQDNY